MTTDQVGVFFQDPSEREDGYKINIDDIEKGKVLIDGNTQAFVKEGDVELVSEESNTPSKFSIGEDYQINANKVSRGSKKISIVNFNPSGETKVEMGYADVFRRSNLYLYIGDEEVMGTGNISELSLYTGPSGRKLSELVKDCEIKSNRKESAFISSDWKDMQASVYGHESKFGAELSFTDAVSTQIEKPVCIWRLSIPQAIASTAFANGAEGLNYIQNNIHNHITELRGLFTQARISGVIINMDNRDTNVNASYQNLIDWLRTYFEFPDLPIVVTDRRGVSQDIKDQTLFEVIDRGDRIGSYYRERDMLGFYGYAEAKSNSSMIWKKLFNPDGTPYTGVGEFEYWYSDIGLSYPDKIGRTARNMQNWSYLQEDSLTNDSSGRYFSNSQKALHHDIFGAPSPFGVSERSDVAYGLAYWRDYWKFNTYEEMQEWGWGYGFDFNSWMAQTGGNIYQSATKQRFINDSLYTYPDFKEFTIYKRSYIIGPETIELKPYGRMVVAYSADYNSDNVRIGYAHLGYLPTSNISMAELGDYDQGSSVLGSSQYSFKFHTSVNSAISGSGSNFYRDTDESWAMYLPHVDASVGMNIFKSRGFRLFDINASFMMELETDNKNVSVVNSSNFERINDEINASDTIDLGYEYASKTVPVTPSVDEPANIAELQPFWHIDAQNPVLDGKRIRGTFYSDYEEKGYHQFDYLNNVCYKLGRERDTDYNQVWFDDYDDLLNPTPTGRGSANSYLTHINYMFNGLPCYNLNTEIYQFDSNQFVNAEQYSIWIIVQPTTAAQGKLFFGQRQRFLLHLPWVDSRAYFDYNERNIVVGNRTINTARISLEINANVPMLVVVGYDKSRNKAFFRLNGVLLRDQTMHQDATANLPINKNQFYLNGGYGPRSSTGINASWWRNPCLLGEMFVSPKKLNFEDYWQYEKTLMDKWRINYE